MIFSCLKCKFAYGKKNCSWSCLLSQLTTALNMMNVGFQRMRGREVCILDLAWANRVEGDDGVVCYVLHPHVSWPGHSYRDSLPSTPPTIFFTGTSWRALHKECTSGELETEHIFHFPYLPLFSELGVRRNAVKSRRDKEKKMSMRMCSKETCVEHNTSYL